MIEINRFADIRHSMNGLRLCKPGTQKCGDIMRTINRIDSDFGSR